MVRVERRKVRMVVCRTKTGYYDPVVFFYVPFFAIKRLNLGPMMGTENDRYNDLEVQVLISEGRYEEATSRLIHEFQDKVIGFCINMMPLEKKDIGLDLAQDAFFEAYKSMHGFRGKSTVATWLFSIVRHKCLDELRRIKREERRHQEIRNRESLKTRERGTVSRQRKIPIPGESGNPAAVIFWRADIEFKKRVIDQLPSLDRTTVKMATKYGIRETAEMLEISENAVRKRISRARKKASDIMNSRTPGEM